MEVVFGVQARDGAIRIQIADDKVDALKKQIEAAFAGSSSVIWVQTKEGRDIGFASDKLAFVEFGAEKAERQVGFASNG